MPFQLFFRNNRYSKDKYRKGVKLMSQKTELLVVGALSVALFTGFTGYSHFIGKGKTIPMAPKPAIEKNIAPSSVSAQNTADSQIAPPVDPTPADTTRKKNTKTKAS